MQTLATSALPSTPILLSKSGVEPVTMPEMQAWLRIDLEDATLAGLIAGARDWFERAMDRELTLASYELRLRFFPWEIEIPDPPLVSILAIKYLDVNGVLQTIASTVYNVVTSRVPAVIQPKFDQIWPATAVHPEAVRITYSAGDVSELVKVGIKVLATHWYENRGDGLGAGARQEVPLAVQNIAWAAASYRF